MFASLNFLNLDLLPLLGVLPRGDLTIFSTLKLIVVIAAFFLWLRSLVWLDEDADHVGLQTEIWDLIALVSFAIGMSVFFFVPIYTVALTIAVLIYGGSMLAYLSQRDRKVSKKLRILGPQFVNNLFGSGSGSSSRESEPERKVGKKAKSKPDENTRDAKSSDESEEAPVGIPITFKGRGTKVGEDGPGSANIDKSPGLKSAVELLWEAIGSRATDIHLEPEREMTVVRFRIDSMMQQASPFSRQRGDSVVNIFKNLAGLDITEKRKPQDGSFTATVEGRHVDFRVATAGSVNGEKLVMRILDSSRQMKGLSDTGLRESMRVKIEDIIASANGMLITCGPTGAGKTSTLYSCLMEIDRFQRNVITLENPVEYHLENITQIEISERQGKTFANELRSILRQDPDVILVGEIRDAETAEIACQAAQTGHMVLSTLHANDTVTALTRLLDLGVKPFMIAAALTGVLGQRLVRLLCTKCRVACTPPADVLAKFKIPAGKIKSIYRAAEKEDLPASPSGEPKVCKNCGGAGYIGRTGIFELLILSDEIRSLLRSAALDVPALKQAALKTGLVTLYDEGLKKVLEGKTSIAELQRVAR